MNFTPTISQLKMLASLRGNLWMVHEEKSVELALAALEFSEKTQKETWSDEELAEYYTLRQKSFIDENGIGHIEVRGAMLMDCRPLYERVGLAIRYSTIIGETNAAIEAGAKGILYKVNSPGGTVSGNVEASKMVMGLPVPTVSFCEGLACSAAYKLVAGTNFICASESALMGNIGTILSWADCSEFWKKWGVEMKAITSEGASLKSTFHLEPNEEQLAFLQESVNEAGEKFRNHVITGRARADRELDAEVWKAGWYSGEKAGQLGLIDGIGTYADAYKKLTEFVNLTFATPNDNLTP
jgi:ClpP class serine protease